VLALGSRPNDFAIPGLAERALSVYSASDAERVWAAASKALDDAAAAVGPGLQRRLATVVVGGGGATGVSWPRGGARLGVPTQSARSCTLPSWKDPAGWPIRGCRPATTAASRICVLQPSVGSPARADTTPGRRHD
jgi:hypothetical protein